MEDFTALPVCFQSSSGSTSTHTIYCKEHSVKKSSELTPNGRTLFTVGWPPYAIKSCVMEVFSHAGHVQEVILQSKGGTQAEDEPVTKGFKV